VFFLLKDVKNITSNRLAREEYFSFDNVIFFGPTAKMKLNRSLTPDVFLLSASLDIPFPAISFS